MQFCAGATGIPRTGSALACDSAMLWPSAPVLSVWPSTVIEPPVSARACLQYSDKPFPAESVKGACYQEFLVIGHHTLMAAKTPNALLHGALDALILKTLARGPCHRYAVARFIEETSSNTVLVEEGPLYPALYRLERRGWVEAEWGMSELGRRRSSTA